MTDQLHSIYIYIHIYMHACQIASVVFDFLQPHRP